MAVHLGTLPRGTQYVLREVSRARSMSPTHGGGPDTMIRRLGDRSAIEVQVPAIASGGCGPGLVVDLLLARTEGAVIAIPEPKVPPGDYGVPLVLGGNQQGEILSVDGLTPGVVIPKGKWLSVIASGRRFAYLTTAEVIANGSGQAALPIWPMIRRSPPDNAVVELAEPKLEGFVQDVVEREVRSIGAISVSFRITERE